MPSPPGRPRRWLPLRRRPLIVVLALAASVAMTTATVSAPPAPSRAALAATSRDDTMPDRPGARAPLIAVTPRQSSLVPRSAPLGLRLTVPILLYHYIRASTAPRGSLGFELSVTPQAFAEQMEVLRASGRTPVTLSQLVDALSGHGRLPPRPVVLTFDDGYGDFATAALPVLVRDRFVATAYVVSGFVGRAGYMSADQVRAAEAAGMVIGSHTGHHVNLAHLPTALAVTEMLAGRAALEQLLGHPVLDFAYPYGAFTTPLVAEAQRAGFRTAVTTLAGDTQALAGRFTLHRDRVLGSTTLADFARAVA